VEQQRRQAVAVVDEEDFGPVLGTQVEDVVGKDRQATGWNVKLLPTTSLPLRVNLPSLASKRYCRGWPSRYLYLLISSPVEVSRVR
jgi:hypothetical protein